MVDLPHNLNNAYRIESDDLGEIKIPETALYGVQTQRAVDNFCLSNLKMPNSFLTALAQIKKIAAEVNVALGLLEKDVGDAIAHAAKQIATGQFKEEDFPVDVFQTGSGTSTNMNMNEVIATIASRKIKKKISPTDHVNKGQSSNDVIPTAIHLSVALECHKLLLPSLTILAKTIEEKAQSLHEVIKTGRTHLMDAMPIRMSQELGAWSCQIRKGINRIHSTLPRIYQIAQGGTAVGTGINAHPDFAHHFATALTAETGLPFTPNNSFFESLSAQDTMVELSGQLKVIAVSLMKISNDLRWMNSGPLAGLGEIQLKPLQAGSSIMPGKVNPVIPEAVAMVAAQVIGNDATITIAGQSGNFQLNTMLPVIAYNIHQSITLLTNACKALSAQCIADFTVNDDNLNRALARNPILITALSPIIGYAKAAEIAKTAYAQGRPILDVALEMTQLDRDKLEKILDPYSLL